METSLIGKALGFGPKECRFESYVSKIKYDKNAFIVNHVNIALSKKIFKKTFHFNNNMLSFLKILNRLGVLKNFIIHGKQKKKITITIFFYRNSTFFSRIRLISTTSKKFYISLNAINKISKSSGSSVFLISTSAGLVTHKEALKKKIGGILIAALS